jgi:monofunctional biosynthetic peptidoglycan transglycosylase
VLARALRWLAFAAIAIVFGLVALIALYRIINPPISALMVQRWLAGEAPAQAWVPLERISPQLVQAVLVSEDARFCQHWGVDLKEIGAALESARDGAPRGASTISMQVAKNLFLWPAKSYVRKAIELPLTLGIELVWPKRRILEVYLNIAEWGPGVFGAEAAARHHFGKSAARLGEREAALLAVSLPDPHDRHAGAPGPGLSRLATTIQLRMRAAGDAAACVLPRRTKAKL